MNQKSTNLVNTIVKIIVEMSEDLLEVVCDLIKIIAQKDSPISLKDIKEFIMSKTYYDVVLEYKNISEKVNEVKHRLGFFQTSSCFGFPDSTVYRDDFIRNLKMKIVSDLKPYKEDEHTYATALEFMFFDELYVKNNIIALGSCEKVGVETYYLAKDRDGKFIMVNIACINSYDKLVVKKSFS